jgi:hypothetical protein
VDEEAADQGGPGSLLSISGPVGVQIAGIESAGQLSLEIGVNWRKVALET